MESHKHGDPLFAATMTGDAADRTADDGPVAVFGKTVHQIVGHGDPILQDIKNHEPFSALHAEFKGHGDPLMDEYLQEWDSTMPEQEGGASPQHKECKVHGDPLLADVIEYDKDMEKLEPFEQLWNQQFTRFIEDELRGVFHPAHNADHARQTDELEQLRSNLSGIEFGW